ncbi:MAG: ABC transporter permease subunit [Chloroflexota bacterium]
MTTIPNLPEKNNGRSVWRTVLVAVVLFLLYAFTVQTIDISLEKPLNPERQEAFGRVLRLLADPEFVQVDAVTGEVALSEAMQTTLGRIVETIFMALMATTVGTVLAVPVSFLAARNLMEPVTAPLAAIMVALAALPVGGWLGSQLARLLLGAAAQVAGQPLLGVVAAVAVATAVYLLLRSGLPDAESEAQGDNRAAMLRLLLAVILLVLGLGLVAQVGVVAGKWLDTTLGSLGFLGNFVFVLSDFILIGLPALLGTLGAFLAASYGSYYGQEAVLRLNEGSARALTVVATLVGTAVLVYGIGSALNWLYLFDNPERWTTIPAVVVAIGAAVVAGFLRAKRPFAIGFVIYTISRSILNALRSIEPLIMGIVFVVWVSLGPFAGIMALTLHTIAALGKLFSEQIEGIDEGPIEALLSTGASRLQMIVYAVIPQIIPPYIAFTLYRWDINVRMSTIIGFVGGGGIGFVLSQNIQQLRYRQASVMMIAIALVVMLLDYVSSRIRSRII